MKRLMLLLALATTPLAAQDLEGFAGMRFRFEAPGARSAAMGGTTEALSDSFSVATNPASLAQIRERRVAVDARQSTDSTDFVSSGTLGNLATTRLETKSSGPRGVVLILPTRHATWALFADKPLDTLSPTAQLGLGERNAVRLGIRDGQLIPIDQCNFADGCTMASFDGPIALRANGQVQLERIGTALAVNLGRVSIGGAAVWNELQQQTGSPFASNYAKGHEITWNGGVQWQIAPAVRAGASYRSGGQFESLQYQYEQSTWQRSFHTPASYGAGLAIDVRPNLTVAFDAQRVNYSDLWGSQRQGYLEMPNQSVVLAMPNVTELRAGAEYRIATRLPIALRAGWWRDPSHRVRAVATYSGSGPTVVPLEYFNLGLLDEDENHLTAGIGVGSRIRLDAAIDRSEHTTRGSLTIASTF